MSRRMERRKKQQPRFELSGRNLIIAFGIIALILVGAVVLLQGEDEAEVSADSNSLPREISVDTAAELRDDGALMLDVREQSEWDEFHMPGAQLIPLGELPSRLSELPKDQKIVVVCRSGNRSATGRDILLDAGFTNVTSMAGGMNEWRSAGYDVE